MINRGFTQTQKAFNGLKDDVDGLKDDIDGVKHIQQDIRKELSATPADVRYLRCSAEPLTRHEAERDALLSGKVNAVRRDEGCCRSQDGRASSFGGLRTVYPGISLPPRAPRGGSV